MPEAKRYHYEDEHALAPLCCIFIAVMVFALSVGTNYAPALADLCMKQQHEITIIDNGNNNTMLEVSRKYCDYKQSATDNVARWRNMKPYHVFIGRHETGWNNKDFLVLRNNAKYYTDTKNYEYIHIRGDNNSMLLSTGRLAISGSGNVYCGIIEFDLEIVGSNNTVYRVVTCS